MHLAAPARRLGIYSVARQTDDASSMLELYRTALRMRWLLPALGDGCLQWLSMPEGALGFAREPGFLCVVNYSAAPVVLPDDAVILLASDEFDPGRGAGGHDGLVDVEGRRVARRAGVGVRYRRWTRYGRWSCAAGGCLTDVRLSNGCATPTAVRRGRPRAAQKAVAQELTRTTALCDVSTSRRSLRP